MTAEQQNIVDQLEDIIIADILLCIEKLEEIDSIGNKGHVPLPATAANGKPVLHGANLNIYYVRLYYEQRLKNASVWVKIDDSLNNKVKSLVNEKWKGKLCI